MNLDEYARMRGAEDRHWWYKGLRCLVWRSWATLAQNESLPVLDIGCGTGGTIAGAPCRVVGVDRSAEAVRLCRQRGLRALIQADADALPFADNSFSGAISLDVLYHRAVPDPVHALREALRVLAPGGHVILNLPAYDWLRSSHDEAIHTARRFTRGRLREMLTDAGFEVVRVTHWNTLLFPAAVAVRLARRHSEREASDLDGYKEGVGTVAARFALRLERVLMSAFDLPFGLSVLAVARRVE